MTSMILNVELLAPGSSGKTPGTAPTQLGPGNWTVFAHDKPAKKRHCEKLLPLRYTMSLKSQPHQGILSRFTVMHGVNLEIIACIHTRRTYVRVISTTLRNT